MADDRRELDLGDQLVELASNTSRLDASKLVQLADREHIHEKRLRRMALYSWSTTFASLPLMAVLMFIIRNGGGDSVEAARAALICVGIAAALAMLLGVASLGAWLRRPRSATLTAIEQRLRAIEDQLR